MTNKLSLTVGDLVVRYGKVLKVFQVNKDTVSLQPYFNFQSSNGLTFTINLDSACDGHIRRLVSKKELKHLLDLIIKKPISKDRCPAFDAESALSQNKFTDTLWVIKTLWLEKQEKSDSLPGGKLNIYKKAVVQTTEEIAAVNRTSPEEAELSLLSGLKSSLKR